ncbi:GntR family transcriptional regulator [Pseudochelatococcus sp. B33]
MTERLREAILDGEFELGDALSEDKLATILGVSRSPVREAFTALAQEGLIDIRPQRGSFVFLPTKEDTDNLCEFRKMIECEAMRLAMQRKRDETLAGMKSAATEMDKAMRADDHLGAARADTKFHSTAIENSGNPYLINAYRLAAGKVATLRSHRSTLPTRQTASREHFEIIEHLDAGDMPGALDALGAHILKMAERYGIEATRATEPRNGRATRRPSFDHLGPLPD